MKPFGTLSAIIMLTMLPLIAFASSGQSQAAAAATAPQVVLPFAAPANVEGRTPLRDGSDEDSIAYTYGFEDGLGDWTTMDLTESVVRWHSTETHAMDDGRSFWVGDEEIGGYENHWLQYIVSPVLNLAGRQNLRLTFDVLWACEDTSVSSPVADYPDYNGWDGCNVWISTDGGENWEVLRPVRPAYSFSSLFSFGWEWGMGPDIPGWAGFSDGFVGAEFNLANYAQNNVRLRWAFCSDPGWATPDDQRLIGMLVDNMEVRDGNGVIWSNNGDELGDMSLDQGPFEVGGDFWDITDDDAHDGQFSARCPVRSNIRDALVSPPLEIPAGLYTYFEFWVRADHRIHDSNGDGNLDDYWEIQYSVEGQAWTRMFYDWSRNDAAYRDDFHYFGPDDFFNSQSNGAQPEWMRKLNLTQFAGREVRLRWVANNDTVMAGDQGTGLYIDDFALRVVDRREWDSGVKWAWLKHPNAMGFPTVQGRVAVTNYGLNGLGQVTKFYRIDNGTNYPITPWGPIESDSTKEFGFSVAAARLTYADSVKFAVHAHAANDTTSANDTAWISNVVVYPANIWNLGYDNRSINFRYGFNQGIGAAIKFTPSAEGIRGAYDLKALRVRWAREQLGQANVQTRLHVYADTRGVPGQELHTSVIDVGDDDIYPNVQIIDLTAVEALSNIELNFWVWFETLREDALPQIIGDAGTFGFGAEHYFSYNGDGLTELDAEFQCRALIMPAANDAQNELVAGRSVLDFGGVIVGTTSRLRVALFNGGTNEVTITGVTSTNADFDVDFNGPVTIGIGSLAHVYVNFTAEELGDAAGELEIQSSDNEPPRITLEAEGLGVSDDETAPLSFNLGSAYPNPFNSTTVIPFSLGAPANTKLAVYDLAGRQVALLVSGKLEAGSHSISFRAGDLASGVYLYRLDAGSFTSIRKVIFIK